MKYEDILEHLKNKTESSGHLREQVSDIVKISVEMQLKFGPVLHEIIGSQVKRKASVMSTYLGLIVFAASELALGATVIGRNIPEFGELETLTVKWFAELFKARMRFEARVEKMKEEPASDAVN